MRIGVISDSHGNIVRIEQAVAAMDDIAALLHAGDFGEGFKHMEMPFPTYYVRGNCDWEDFNTPEELIINLDGKRILLTHGHKYDVKTRLTKLEYLAEQEQVQIVVFGHSHEPFKELKAGVLFLNPGGLIRPRNPMGPTYAIITIEGENITAEIIPLNKN